MADVYLQIIKYQKNETLLMNDPKVKVTVEVKTIMEEEIKALHDIYDSYGYYEVAYYFTLRG